MILFIVEDVTYNVCDQKFHEFEIRKLNPEVYVIRKTLTEIANEGHLGPQKRLFIGNQEVAVVYFRYVNDWCIFWNSGKFKQSENQKII